MDTLAIKTEAEAIQSAMRVLDNGDKESIDAAKYIRTVWSVTAPLIKAMTLGRIKSLSYIGADSLRGMRRDVDTAVNAYQSRKEAAKTTEALVKARIQARAADDACMGPVLEYPDFCRYFGLNVWKGANHAEYYEPYLITYTQVNQALWVKHSQ